MKCKLMQKNNTSWYIVLNMGTKKSKTKFHATLKSPVFTGALGVHQWSFWGFLAKKSEIVRHIMTHYYQKITSALNFFNNYQFFIWEAKWNTPLGVSSDIHTLLSRSLKTRLRWDFQPTSRCLNIKFPHNWIGTNSDFQVKANTYYDRL